MFEAQMRKFVRENEVDFAAGHAAQQVIRERDGISFAGEGIGHLPFAGGDDEDLLELNSESMSHSEGGIAEVTGGQSVRLHANEFQEARSGYDLQNQGGENEKHAAAEISSGNCGNALQTEEQREES